MAVLVGLRCGEHLVEMARDLVAVRVERGDQRSVVGQIHRFGQHRLRFGIVRQQLGLRVVQILNAMFQTAQKIIGGSEFLLRIRRHQPALHQFAQHGQGRALLQGGDLAAADELEHLRGEFDFADAARPQLDVVRHLAARDLAPDLHMQIANRGEGAEVEVFAKHERPHDVRQFVVVGCRSAGAP